MKTKIKTIDGNIHYIAYVYASDTILTQCDKFFNKFKYSYTDEKVTCSSCKLNIIKQEIIKKRKNKNEINN